MNESFTFAIFLKRVIFMGLKRYILVINFIHICDFSSDFEALQQLKIAIELKNRSLERCSTHLNTSDFFSFQKSLEKSLIVNSTLENNSIYRSEKRIAGFSLEKIAKVNKP